MYATKTAHQESRIMMFPSEVVTTILQHVPQRQRFDQCALVCSSWRAAAVEASTSIDTRTADVTQLKSLSMWLECYGSKLLHLSIAGPEQQNAEELTFHVPFLQLQQLRTLHLSHMTIEARSSTNDSNLYSGAWAKLTALASLHVVDTVLDSRDVSEFSGITSLRRLVLSDVGVCTRTGPSVTFPTQITCLILDSVGFDGELKGIGLSSHLEHLKLAFCDVDISSALSELPLSLTHLELNCYHNLLSAARLGELTALVHLEVEGAGSIDPQLLSNLVQLRHLCLKGLNGHRLSFHHNASDVAGAERLLAVLPGLSQLECLDLADCKVAAVGSVRQYSALVSSSALTCLDLRDCYLQDNAVLHDHMFTAGRRCPALQVLRLGLHDWCAEFDEVPDNVCHGALDALVHACPALRELQLWPAAVDPSCWVQLPALQRLTGLSKLALGGYVVHDNSIALLTSLELPSLRRLTIRAQYGDQDTFTARGLLSLCGMTQLTRLKLWHRGLGCESSKFKLSRVILCNENGLTCLEELIKSEFKSNLKVLTLLLERKSEEVKAAVARAEAAESKVYHLEQRVAQLEQQSQEQRAVSSKL